MITNLAIHIKNLELPGAEYICMHNGAKQGAIISPILFTINIDDLLIKLKHSCIGCNIYNQYIGALTYADDITLS